MAGHFGLRATHTGHSHEQQQHHHAWLPEAGEWQRREADYKAQLERHYFAEQEAEYQAQVAEYYTARREHQQHQQRLNQVLYGHCAGYLQQHHTTPATNPGSQPNPFQPNRHAQQQGWPQGWQQQQQQQQEQQLDAMECCSPAPSSPSLPRAPLVNCNFRPLAAASPAWRGIAAGGGAGWEGPGLAAGVGSMRKRSHEAAALGEACGGTFASPGTAAKRRALLRRG